MTQPKPFDLRIREVAATQARVCLLQLSNKQVGLGARHSQRISLAIPITPFFTL